MPVGFANSFAAFLEGMAAEGRVAPLDAYALVALLGEEQAANESPIQR